MSKSSWFRSRFGFTGRQSGKSIKRRRAARRTTPLSIEHLESRSLLAAVPAGLVSWYRAENDATDFVGNNDGTLLNGATFTAGKVGQAFSFDGSDDQVVVPHNANQNFGGQMTIEAWVNPSTIDHGRPIAQKRSSGNVGGFTFETTHSSISGEPANGLQFVVWLGDFANFRRLATPANALTIGQWQHVAATYDGGTMRIFVNGVEVATRDDLSGFITPTSDPLVIGRNVVIPSFAWHGAIDEISFYNRALSQAEVQSVVDAGSEGKQFAIVVNTAADTIDADPGVTSLREAINASNASVGVLDTINFNIPRPSTDGLVSWYRGEGNANDSIDSNAGTLQNGATFGAGRYGQAFDLDGVDDFFTAPDAANLDGMAQLTVDAWVKFDTLPVGKEQFILSKALAVGVGSNSYAIWLQGNTMRLTAAVETVSGLQTVQATETFFDTTGFHHLALTYDGATVRLFVDGLLKSSGALSGSILNTPYPYLIGRRSGAGVDGNGDAFNGLVDESGIFNRALSAAEIQAIASGVRTINLTSALPTITDPVIIDGYTQPGASTNTDADGFNGTLLVELNGTNSGAAVGLDIAAGGSTIRGLVINRFSQEAIVLRGGDGNVIEGNLLGTDSTGNVALPNRGGIISYLGSDANRIGGTAPEARNIISGNLRNGIELNGVELAGFDAGSANNMVQGNFLGTNAAGTAALGNGIHGVFILNGSQGNSVGGADFENIGNRIAFNAGAGVKVEGANTTSTVLGNSIFANGGLGIDLDNTGVTPNDPGDTDGGPNRLQNAPAILSLTSSLSELGFTASLDAEPDTKYRVEFFASDSADPSGYGEGQRLLGEERFVITNASGHITFTHELPPVASDQWITVTATRLDDETYVETSEFSQAVAVTAAANADLAVTISDSPDPAFLGESVTYTVGVTNHGPASATGVIVVAAGPTGQQFNSVTIPVGGLSSGTSSSFQLQFTPTVLGTFSATATVFANEDDPNPSNNSFSETTLVKSRLTFELAQAQYEVREGEAFAVLTVRKLGDIASSGSVEFTTMSGTAGQRGIGTAFSRIVDFTTTSGELFFRSRSNVATIRVPIGDDGILEPDESFRVVLSNPSAGAELGAITSAEVIIHDNDPTLSFLAGSSERNEGQTGRTTIEVRLQPASNQTVTVVYAAASGSATPGADFTLTGSRTLTFRPGETRKFVNFATVNDTLYEGDETAFIELSSPTNAFLGEQARHRVRIIDNDPVPPPADPGSTIGTALAIDLATLPRQSYRQHIGKSDVDTFKVQLGPLERLALDVDPSSFTPGLPTLPNSKLRIIEENGQTLANIGASAEPDTGLVTNNAAHLFQADADGGTYYIQLTTTGTSKGYGYSLGFHHLGVSENVPSPDKLNASGPMYAFFDSVDTVGITGPTGYGFTLVGPWQHEATTSRPRALSSQKLTMPQGSRFLMKSPQGVELPLLANKAISISTKSQRWGNLFGVVDADAIKFPVAIDIVPLNNLLASTFGSQFATAGLLSGEWRISLGGRAFNIVSGFGTGIEATEIVDQLLPGVPYLRKFEQSVVDANVGGFRVSQLFDRTPLNWIFDPADPMLFVRVPSGPGVAVSTNALLQFRPEDPPDGSVEAGITEFAGHLYANATIPLPVPGFPVSIGADVVINVDADRDGKPLGDLADIGQLGALLAGDPSEVREILRDIQIGANGRLNVSAPAESKIVQSLLTLELGRASVVLNGLAETVWLRGEFQGRAFNGTSIELADSSVLMEGLIDFGSNDFLYIQRVTTDSTGIELGFESRISNEGVSLRVFGGEKWSVKIDRNGVKVSGTAEVSFEALVAIEIDDDGDVHLAGSVSASGKLKARIAGETVTLFSDSVEASVRSRGLRFRFPRGVGNLDFDLF